MVQTSDAQEPWADDPAFQDAMLDAPVIRADEGFVLRSPDGSFAFDLAVQTLTKAVDVLPRHWRLLDIRVERKGLRRTAVVEVTAQDGRHVAKAFTRWQMAEAMMPGNPWLEQHGFKLRHRTKSLFRAERLS